MGCMWELVYYIILYRSLRRPIKYMEDRACQGSKLRCEWKQIGTTQLMSDPQIYHGISEPWSPQKKGVTGPGSPRCWSRITERKPLKSSHKTQRFYIGC